MSAAPVDLSDRIRRQLALGIHPATGAVLTDLERAFYLAILAGLPGMAERLTELYAARAAASIPLTITE